MEVPVIDFVTITRDSTRKHLNNNTVTEHRCQRIDSGPLSLDEGHQNISDTINASVKMHSNHTAPINSIKPKDHDLTNIHFMKVH